MGTSKPLPSLNHTSLLCQPNPTQPSTIMRTAPALFCAALGLAAAASLGANAAPTARRAASSPSTSPSSASSSARRKILCLHGGGGSGPSFKRELGADLQTALGSGYELVFPSAPDNGLWMRDPPNGKGEAT